MNNIRGREKGRAHSSSVLHLILHTDRAKVNFLIQLMVPEKVGILHLLFLKFRNKVQAILLNIKKASKAAFTREKANQLMEGSKVKK